MKKQILVILFIFLIKNSKTNSILNKNNQPIQPPPPSQFLFTYDMEKVYNFLVNLYEDIRTKIEKLDKEENLIKTHNLIQEYFGNQSFYSIMLKELLSIGLSTAITTKYMYISNQILNSIVQEVYKWFLYVFPIYNNKNIYDNKAKLNFFRGFNIIRFLMKLIYDGISLISYSTSNNYHKNLISNSYNRLSIKELEESTVKLKLIIDIINTNIQLYNFKLVMSSIQIHIGFFNNLIMNALFKIILYLNANGIYVKKNTLSNLKFNNNENNKALTTIKNYEFSEEIDQFADFVRISTIQNPKKDKIFDITKHMRNVLLRRFIYFYMFNSQNKRINDLLLKILNKYSKLSIEEVYEILQEILINEKNIINIKNLNEIMIIIKEEFNIKNSSYQNNLLYSNEILNENIQQVYTLDGIIIKSDDIIEKKKIIIGFYNYYDQIKKYIKLLEKYKGIIKEGYKNIEIIKEIFMKLERYINKAHELIISLKKYDMEKSNELKFKFDEQLKIKNDYEIEFQNDIKKYSIDNFNIYEYYEELVMLKKEFSSIKNKDEKNNKLRENFKILFTKFRKIMNNIYTLKNDDKNIDEIILDKLLKLSDNIYQLIEEISKRFGILFTDMTVIHIDPIDVVINNQFKLTITNNHISDIQYLIDELNNNDFLGKYGYDNNDNFINYIQTFILYVSDLIKIVDDDDYKKKYTILLSNIIIERIKIYANIFIDPNLNKSKFTFTNLIAFINIIKIHIDLVGNDIKEYSETYSKLLNKITGNFNNYKGMGDISDYYLINGFFDMMDQYKEYFKIFNLNLL